MANFTVNRKKLHQSTTWLKEALKPGQCSILRLDLYIPHAYAAATRLTTAGFKHLTSQLLDSMQTKHHLRAGYVAGLFSREHRYGTADAPGVGFHLHCLLLYRTRHAKNAWIKGSLIYDEWARLCGLYFQMPIIGGYRHLGLVQTPHAALPSTLTPEDAQVDWRSSPAHQDLYRVLRYLSKTNQDAGLPEERETITRQKGPYYALPYTATTSRHVRLEQMAKNRRNRAEIQAIQQQLHAYQENHAIKYLSADDFTLASQSLTQAKTPIYGLITKLSYPEDWFELIHGLYPTPYLIEKRLINGQDYVACFWPYVPTQLYTESPNVLSLVHHYHLATPLWIESVTDTSVSGLIRWWYDRVGGARTEDYDHELNPDALATLPSFLQPTDLDYHGLEPLAWPELDEASDEDWFGHPDDPYAPY